MKITATKALPILLCLLAIVPGLSSQNPGHGGYVVMLSLDGFRWDYAQHANTPNLDSIAAFGVMAESVRPSFPTKTFPNHYSIATGLYPDHHGIVLNSFYDPATGRNYKVSDRKAVEDGSFYGGEPIWVTAEKQGVRSASYFWVGSEADIQGIHPTYWKKYQHRFPYEQRVDSVIHWLSLPYEERPKLVLWYMDEPDGVGHDFGPLSPECISTVEELDAYIGDFLRKARTLPHYDSINFIFLSDHGMGPISTERVVYLSDHIRKSWLEHLEGSNPVYVLQAKEAYEDSVYSALASVEHIKAWRTGELPERLHYGTNERCLGMVVAADSAWSVSWDRKPSGYNGGTHGYDNENRDMHAIFYATGPAFRKGIIAPTFNNVDIYPLVCHLLGLHPAPVDGNLDHTLDLLIQDK